MDGASGEKPTNGQGTAAVKDVVGPKEAAVDTMMGEMPAPGADGGVIPAEYSIQGAESKAPATHPTGWANPLTHVAECGTSDRGGGSQTGFYVNRRKKTRCPEMTTGQGRSPGKGGANPSLGVRAPAGTTTDSDGLEEPWVGGGLHTYPAAAALGNPPADHVANGPATTMQGPEGSVQRQSLIPPLLPDAGGGAHVMLRRVL
uniref:Uncharacterized protein n=1 Tax=Sphaerodactylus townsendi TaxID=933632 RepID=A0ACB8EBW1_9SAUR